jgi:hypothetical protein
VVSKFIDRIQPALFEFTQDTNRCVFSLLFTGTLARFPDIRAAQAPLRCALQANRLALAALFAYVLTSLLLLGSNFPFGTSADGTRGLEEYGLKPGDLEAIYRGKADRPLPRLKV